MSESDLVTRLRTTRLLSQRNQMALQTEAAVEIERLRRQCEAMEKAIAASRPSHASEG